jgi:hypothetical protein
MADWSAPLRLAQKATYLQAIQELCGFRFDIEKARALTLRIRKEMQEIEQEVLPQLPPRPLKKTEEAEYTLPAKPFKQDGTFSVHMLRFLEKHGCSGDASLRTVQWNGEDWSVEGGKLLPATKPMELGNQEDIKNWLFAEGWEPTLFNLKKDKNGKVVRDPKTKAPIQTTPKMQENGRLCPNLEAMSGPLVRLVVRWMSYRNRLSVLEGWLANPRLAFDGRLTAGSTGVTNTFRQKHTVVTNVPKNKEHVLLGREFRELFTANEGQVLVGYDASALEDRIKGALTWKYDGGEYARKILAEGYDPHQENADIWGIDRSIAKNGTYALGYFCGVKKLATTIKCSQAEAEGHYEAYWKLNDALKQLDEALALHWESNGKKYIVGIDGRKVYSRARNSLVNLAIQSTASIIMDYSQAWIDRKLGGVSLVDGVYPCYTVGKHRVFRVMHAHDEYQYSCDPEVAEYVGKLGVESIKRAGEFFKLKVPLLGEYNIGPNWASTH